MKIYTGFGDKGNTALFGGQTVKKDNLRVEMYGTLDELNSFLGILSNKNKDSEIGTIVNNIQNEIFIFGSEMATPPAKERGSLAEYISEKHVNELEKAIDKITEELPELKNFILPGGSEAACYSHVARTVCRRAERMLIKLAEGTEIREVLIVYLNRLSDLLFTIARYENKIEHINEVIWEGIRK